MDRPYVLHLGKGITMVRLAQLLTSDFLANSK